MNEARYEFQANDALLLDDALVGLIRQYRRRRGEVEGNAFGESRLRLSATLAGLEAEAVRRGLRIFDH